MGLFSRESDEAKALKADWKTASEDAQNTDPGTAAGARAMRDQTKAAQAYQDQVNRDKNK